MINELFSSINKQTIAFSGILIAFALTCFFLSKASKFLPKDQGREFAHDGKLSAGKPRGAGIIFILIFAVVSLLFAQLTTEIVAYIILVIIAMITGYLDDASKAPWGEYKKGFLDLLIAVAVAFTYISNNGTQVVFATTGYSPKFVDNNIVFGILTVLLVWVSINVTNCSDGVDGLSGTVSMISLATIYIMDFFLNSDEQFDYLILVFVVCILGYLWYNATPSKLMMGDAGSRSMGLFIALAVLKSGSPFMYFFMA
ncbi:MAG: phospho-N-acetylmuramoyl-pentapeptide-transferase [Lachnospiraceae bacterium]|nr:phospho-N-acetylmuramoyl-pentapeptide-transferase [Lachnospiraceae bacterium]